MIERPNEKLYSWKNSGIINLISTYRKLRFENNLTNNDFLQRYGQSIEHKLRSFRTQNPITVLICAWNEIDRLPKLLRALSLSRIPVKPLVVDNNSTDGTGTIARELGAEVIEEKNQGLMSALITGFRFFAESQDQNGLLITDADTYPTPDWPYAMTMKGALINDYQGGVLYGQSIFYEKLLRDSARTISELTGSLIYLMYNKVNACGPNCFIKFDSQGNIIKQLTERLNPHIEQRTDRYIRDSVITAHGQAYKDLSLATSIFTSGDRYPTFFSLFKSDPYGHGREKFYKEWLDRAGAIYYESPYDLWR